MGRIVRLGIFQRQSADLLLGIGGSTGTIDTRRKSRQALSAAESTFFDRCGDST